MATRGAGFTLIEVVVAMLLFAVGAAALAQTLVIAQRTRASSARWGQALALAEQRLERWHAGERDDETTQVGEFTLRTTAEAFDGSELLERVAITVEWQDRGPQRLALAGLLRRSR
jgi:prepilin-type N-terminal cleavage/methylation domain-containing protein